MKVLKLHGHKSNDGGIVNFQNSLAPLNAASNQQYIHFRTGKIHNSKLFSISVIRLLDLLFSYCLFPFFLIYKQPDVIEVNSSLVPAAFSRDFWYAKIASFIRPNAKLVLFNHGWNYEFEAQILLENKEKFSIFFNLFNTIIVLTQNIKKELETLGIERPVHVVTTGVDVASFIPYQKQSFKNNHLKILFLSRLEKTKGINELLDSIPAILAAYPKTELIIAGSGSYEKIVKEHPIVVKHPDNIKYVGYVRGNDKLQLFSKSDLYVFPSYGEGCPVSVLEAVAIGLPIIYTAVGALPDILSSGKNGLLIEKKSPNSIIEAVLALIEKPALRQTMTENNKKLSEKFDLCIIHKKLELIYTKNG